MPETPVDSSFTPHLLRSLGPVMLWGLALLVNMFIGIIALLIGNTSEIITIACFGALTLYIIAMIAVLALRKKEPMMSRPFRVPFYPYFPVVALVIASASLITMTTLNIKLSLIYFALLPLTYI